MRLRIAVLLTLLVLLPLLVVGWLGARIVRNEQGLVRHQFRELLDSQLVSLDDTLHGFISEHERRLLTVSETRPFTPEALRTISRNDPLVTQAFLLGADGKLDYPVTTAPSEREAAFLERTRNIWESGELFYRPEDLVAVSSPNPEEGQQLMRQGSYNIRSSSASQSLYEPVQNDAQALNLSDEAPQQVSQPGAQQSTWSMQQLDAAGQTAHGWYTWYWGTGMHVIFWRRQADGRIFGLELDSSRLLADMVAVLPATTAEPSFTRSTVAPRFTLENGRGDVLYQWGRAGEELNALQRRTDRPLQPPLQGWRLGCYLPPAAGGNLRLSLMLNLAIVVCLTAAVLVAIGVWLYRETGREMRLASQRVSFVNNVSHELKTPLTNIRMYAELLENSVDDEDDRSRRYVDIVVRESRRLSRLIANVLSFASSRRGEMCLHPADFVPDVAIAELLEQFRPVLESAGIAVEFDSQAPQTMRLDRDVLEQILVNLISNVEKYAAAGKHLAISSRQRDGLLSVTVRDHGPGVPPREREHIFEPFYRASNRVADGTAGTGIGLTISRELAGRHGGSLTLTPADPGVTFVLTLSEKDLSPC